MVGPRSGTALQILVNGEPHAAASTTTVADLLGQLGIRSDRVAVEINLEIVDRNSFESRILKEGDRVEVISFIGGGSG